MNAPQRRWLTVSEVSELLGIRPKSAYVLVARGVLPAARVGRLVRIDAKRLERDLERQAAGKGRV